MMTPSRSAPTRVALLALLAGAIGACAPATQPSPSTRTDAEPTYRFADVTETSGTGHGESRTWGSAWSDYDADGDPDLFIGRHWAPAKLYVNDGGTFAPRKLEPLARKGIDRHACTWGEANGDGRIDLYCAQGAGMGTGSGPNQLLIQTDEGFSDQARAFGVTDRLGRGRTVDWLDYDSDGDLDLFVGNTIRLGVPNVLFRNDRGSFVRAPAGVDEELSTVSSSFSDWDRDGDPDLLVLQHLDPAVEYEGVAYENVEGTFRAVELGVATDRTWLSAAWGDFDADGWTDLHLVGRDESLILRNDRGTLRREHRMTLEQGRMGAWLDVENDGDLDLFVLQGAPGERPKPGSVNAPDFLLVRRDEGFVRVSHSSFAGPSDGNGDAVSTADFDRDGRIDVFVTNGYFHYTGRSMLLANRSIAQGWVGVDLSGDVWNPTGIGARVTVRAGGRVYRHEVTDGFNFRAQHEVGYLHLGIGDATQADVRVAWPDGGRDCVSVPKATVAALKKGAHPCG